MKQIVTALMAWGAPGLLLLGILDGIGIPIPLGVDALLITLCSNAPNKWLLYALIAVLGSVSGSYILFTLARKGGEAYLERHTLSRAGAKFRQWFQHYGLLTVFISGSVPLPTPMKVFVLSAGALGAGRAAFLMVMIGARLARYCALAWLGAAMGGDAWGYLRKHTTQLLWFALALTLILFALVKIADAVRLRRAGPALPPQSPEI